MLDTEIFIKAERIRDVIRYIQLFKNKTIVIHIDDSIIDSPLFSSHIKDICYIHDIGMSVIIVPGARKRINEILRQSQIEWTMQKGTRITKDDAMPLIKMAAFDVSNKIMTSLAAEKKTAVIGNWVKARGKGIQDGIDFGTAGNIDKIQIDAVKTILSNGFIPIFPCIGWSTTGKPYNIGSLQLAATVSVKANANKLFFLTQQTSITKEQFIIPDNTPLSEEGCVPALSVKELPFFIEQNEAIKTNKNAELVAETINLLRIALSACRAGVERVHILNGSLNGTIPCEIFSDFGSGTMIYEDNYGGIRPLRHADIPELLNLIHPFVEKGILLARTEQELFDQVDDFIVYELDGRIRACAALHLYDANGARILTSTNANNAQNCTNLDKNATCANALQGEIAAVAVDQSCSHIGIGPRLVDYLITKGKNQNLKSIFVLTTQTADWFEQLGFVQDNVDSLPISRRAKWSKERGSKVLRKNL